MALPKYMEDCYLKEFETAVKEVNKEKFVVLENTIFYPNSGGQPHDEGTLVTETGEVYKVVYVGKFSGQTSHEVDKPGLEPGDSVICRLDWTRRYTLMRMHTAAHVLSRVIYEEAGAHTSGNQLGLDKSRIDFTLDEFDREAIGGWIDKANTIIAKGGRVIKSEMSRDEAVKIPGFAGPSPHLVVDSDRLRVVNIDGVDAQPCGGTHLDSLEEIGEIVFVKAENKGKNNRRIYYSLK